MKDKAKLLDLAELYQTRGIFESIVKIIGDYNLDDKSKVAAIKAMTRSETDD